MEFTTEQNRSGLRAKWKNPRVKSSDFSFASASLESDKSTPFAPKPGSGWRQVRILDKPGSERLLRGALERVVPTQAGHGIYGRSAFGDGLLYRQASGEIRLQAGPVPPEQIVVDRRYSRHELAAAIAQSVEQDLVKPFPDDQIFLLALGQTNQFRWVLIDLPQRQAVVLFPPRTSGDPRSSLKLGLKVSNLASFAIVDNVWPLIKNPVSSLTRAAHQGVQWAATFLEPRLRKERAKLPALATGPGMDLVAWEEWLDQHSGSKREHGRIRLLIDGDQFFPLLEQRIRDARHQLDVHMCIFDRDDVAVSFADLLQERSTNLPVRVIFDRLNSRGAGNADPGTPMRAGFTAPRKISQYLRATGDVHLRPQPNPAFSCDHSKVLLIDQKYAYLGGMNIGREYRYEWHDLMAEIEGPIVASFQRQFEKKWAQVGVWGDCGLAAVSISRSKAPDPDSAGLADIDLRRLYTKTFDREIRQAKLAAVKRARHHIYLENAYLFSNDMVDALIRARRRGVDVRVIMPANNDMGPGHKSNIVTANYLHEHGVRVYFYPGMSHVKAFEVDGWLCFGSANFDSLSLRLNREADIATSDPEFVRHFRGELFERDFQKSRELEEPIETSFGDHLADALLNPF